MLGSSTGSDAGLGYRPSWPIWRIRRWRSPTILGLLALAGALALAPTSTAEEAKPDTTAEETEPDTTAEETEPDTTAEEAKPDTTAEEAKPDTTAEEAKPDATAEGHVWCTYALTADPCAVGEEQLPAFRWHREQLDGGTVVYTVLLPASQCGHAWLEAEPVAWSWDYVRCTYTYAPPPPPPTPCIIDGRTAAEYRRLSDPYIGPELAARMAAGQPFASVGELEEVARDARYVTPRDQAEAVWAHFCPEPR